MSTSSAQNGSTAPASKDNSRAQAELLKEKGNKLYAMGKNLAAAEEYSGAILFCPDWAVLYVNRAVCFRRVGDWRRVKEDALKALQLDRNYMKAHFLVGLAYASGEISDAASTDASQHSHYGYTYEEPEDAAVAAAGKPRAPPPPMSVNLNPVPDPTAAAAKVAQAEKEEDDRLDRAVKHLIKAYELSREVANNSAAQAEVWRELAAVQYRRWKRRSAAAKARRQALQVELTQLLGLSGSSPLPARWAAVFKDLERLDPPPGSAPEVPSALTCPLTTSVLRDPVVAESSGRSYERALLLEHLAKVGKFEPVTRQPMTDADIVPNVSLRHAVAQYLEEHPWAWGEA